MKKKDTMSEVAEFVDVNSLFLPELHETHVILDKNGEKNYSVNDVILLNLENGLELPFYIRHIMDVTVSEKGILMTLLVEAIEELDQKANTNYKRGEVVYLEDYKNQNR